MGVRKAKPKAGSTRAATNGKAGLKLSRQMMLDLYCARYGLDLETRKLTGLRMPVEVYFKDPRVARRFKNTGIDPDFTTPWEPGLRDGPSSARFTVVDYDATSNTLTPPAIWRPKQNRFEAPDGTVLDGKALSLFQFHQQSVWAIAQNTLDFFEHGFALGRRIRWAFEGNRLIIVPHAGQGQNAYYDRASKSLQFYWFDDADTGRIYTCLSSDIVNHELGHAILDGLRPHYYESVSTETAAFHEYVGDITAILMAFQNNGFRRRVLDETRGALETGELLSGLAHEFGEAVTGDPYLRSALRKTTMKQTSPTIGPHALSEVLTGAMFDILMMVFARHRKDDLARAKADPKKKPSDRSALATTVPRMQMFAFQPLDLLPPCSVTFRDYALAVLRSEQVANPTDPQGYRAKLLGIFVKRGILTAGDRTEALKPAPLFRRLDLDVSHSIGEIAGSRAGAYAFLDDNRARLFIPPNADVIVTDVARARKFTREGRALPDQIVVQYIWREEILLEGRRFGRLTGERTALLCGGTMVLDDNRNLIHWSRKPGSVPVGDTSKPTDRSRAMLAEEREGRKRRRDLLATLAARVEAGLIGDTVGGELGIVERASPPFGLKRVDGAIRFQLAPHFSITDEEQDQTGDRQWQISF
jgi:hypothetical protein